MIIDNFGEQHRRIFSTVAKTEYTRMHFSQLGEDCILWHFLGHVRNGIYVDVGCHHPFRYSNTALLSIFNDWIGLNIDADFRAIELFNIHRPRDINLHCAVGKEAGQAEIALFNDGAVNSLDPEVSERTEKQGFGTPTKQIVNVFPLRDILDRYIAAGSQVDLLTIDVEGWDRQVIESSDWTKYRPRIVCLEAHEFDINNPQANAVFNLMQSLGYKLMSHLLVTSIYVLKD